MAGLVAHSMAILSVSTESVNIWNPGTAHATPT